MFNNVGGKLKTIAGFFTWVGIAAAVIIGIAIIDLTTFLVGLMVMAIGSFISWISSLGLYAFGELVENSTIIAAKCSESEIVASTPVANRPATKSTVYSSTTNNIFKSASSGTAPAKYCPHCGEPVKTSICGMCGQRNNLFDK